MEKDREYRHLSDFYLATSLHSSLAQGLAGPNVYHLLVLRKKQSKRMYAAVVRSFLFSVHQKDMAVCPRTESLVKPCLFPLSWNRCVQCTKWKRYTCLHHYTCIPRLQRCFRLWCICEGILYLSVSPSEVKQAVCTLLYTYAFSVLIYFTHKLLDQNLASQAAFDDFPL